MSNWWYSLGSKRQGWFLISGFLGLMVVGFGVAIMAGTSMAVVHTLVPFFHLGMGTGLFGLVGAFVTAMVRM